MMAAPLSTHKGLMEFNVKGLAELDKTLSQLPLAIQKKVVRQAASAGATVFKKEAAKNLKTKWPQAMRLLKRIIARKKKKSPPWMPIYEVSWAYPDAFWGLFLELGWHATGPRKKRGLTRKSAIVGTRFIPGKPWLRPAFDSKHRQAAEKVKEKLAQGIEREAAKLGRR